MSMHSVVGRCEPKSNWRQRHKIWPRHNVRWFVETYVPVTLEHAVFLLLFVRCKNSCVLHVRVTWCHLCNCCCVWWFASWYISSPVRKLALKSFTKICTWHDHSARVVGRFCVCVCVCMRKHSENFIHRIADSGWKYGASDQCCNLSCWSRPIQYHTQQLSFSCSTKEINLHTWARATSCLSPSNNLLT